MQLGYARVSKHDGSQVLDLQLDALRAEGVDPEQFYTDRASGKRDDRPGLESCLKALRKGDVLLVYKIDRIGRSLSHLIKVADRISEKGAGLRVLSGKGAQIDTTDPTGRLIFNLLGAIAEFERELIAERTQAGLAAARARGRMGGRPPKITPQKIRMARLAITDPETNVTELCRELGISRGTLYRHVAPDGTLRPDGVRVLERG